MRFETLLDRHERGESSQVEAAELPGIGERTFRRWRDRYVEDGRDGLVDRRIGRPSGRRAPEGELARMLGLCRTHYEAFTVKHFHEQLRKRHGYKLGYTVTKLRLHMAGLVKPAVKRSAHRKKRPRRPMVGMMLHLKANAQHSSGGRLAASVARSAGARPARSNRDAGRRDGRDLFCVSGRGGRDGLELSLPARDRRGARAFLPALYGSRQPLFSHAEGRRAGVEDGADAGRAGAGATGRRAYRGLFAASARPRFPTADREFRATSIGFLKS